MPLSSLPEKDEEFDINAPPPPPPWDADATPSESQSIEEFDINAPPPPPPWEVGVAQQKTPVNEIFHSDVAAKKAHTKEQAKLQVAAPVLPLHNKDLFWRQQTNAEVRQVSESKFSNSSSQGARGASDGKNDLAKISELNTPKIRPPQREISTQSARNSGSNPESIRRVRVLQSCFGWSFCLVIVFFLLGLAIKKYDFFSKEYLLLILACQLLLIGFCFKSAFQREGFLLHSASGKKDGFHVFYSYLPSLWGKALSQREIIDWKMVRDIKVVRAKNWSYGLGDNHGPFLKIELARPLISGRKSLMVEVESEPDELKARLKKLIEIDGQVVKIGAKD